MLESGVLAVQLELLFLSSPPLASDYGNAGAAAEGSAVQRAEVSALLPHGELSSRMLESERHAHCAPRAAAITFVAALAQQAGVAPGREHASATCNNATRDALAAGQALLQHMMRVVRDNDELQREMYVKGDATHRLKLRAWQVIAVLACFMTADELDSSLGWLLEVLHRFDVASVKQYQERGAG